MNAKGFWKLDDLQAAKRLVRNIVDIAHEEGTLNAYDAKMVVSAAREIMAAVRANKPAEELVLPL